MSQKARRRRLAALQAKSQTVLRQLEANHPLVADAPPLHRAIWTQERHTVACLARGRTATEAHAVGTLTTTQATIWITEILQTPGPPIACKPGCAWCCTIPAAVSPPEALLIAHHLRTTLAPEALAEVRARLQARVAQLKPLTTEQHAEAVIPCALLEENRCMVYEARPVTCRAWTSPDPALCQHGQLRPWEANLVPQIAEVMDVAGATQIGVTAGLLCSDVSAAYMELHSAVLCALDTPHAAARWAQGEPIFRDCTRADRVNAKLETILAEARAASH